MQRGRCARLAITIARPKACNSGIGERIEPAPFEKPSFQEDAMNQSEKAKRFAELHVKGAPLLLYNAWDAGSAKAILAGGAKAIATSSWAVAEAQGFRDGEDLPIEDALRAATRIVTSVEVPASVDFEGGYSEDDGELAANIERLLETGVVGLNFEDRVV